MSWLDFRPAKLSARGHPLIRSFVLRFEIDRNGLHTALKSDFEICTGVGNHERFA